MFYCSLLVGRAKAIQYHSTMAIAVNRFMFSFYLIFLDHKGTIKK